MVMNTMLRTKRMSAVLSSAFSTLASDPLPWVIACGVHSKVLSMVVCTSPTHRKNFLATRHRTRRVGHRMWGALKGAVDGGLHIPHTQKKFP